MSIPYLELALRDAHIIEVRHTADGVHWQSGIFNQLEPLRSAIRQLYPVGNLYITLNRPHADLPVANAMYTRGGALCDDDIATIVRIPADFDPQRPADVMATDAEVQFALSARNCFAWAMRSCGWPVPLMAMSGSGGHALYRCCIQASAELREQLDVIYRRWCEDFSGSGVDFDIKVRNPSRVFRLYGSINRKGENTAERPWRRAACHIPIAWQVVTAQQVDELASRYVRTAPPRVTPRPRLVGSGDYSTLDVVRWVSAHGLYKRRLGDGKHAVTCPWADEHSTKDHPHGSDTVVFETAGGWPGFYCSHAHCEGRGMRELMAQLGDADVFCARAFTPSC